MFGLLRITIFGRFLKMGANFGQPLHRFGQTFFLNRSQFHLESKYLVSCKIWFGIFLKLNIR